VGCHADIDIVQALMAHQLMHIPFENIDVLKRIEILVQPEKIVDEFNLPFGNMAFSSGHKMHHQ
jgi:arylamine N-acetyltransferase